MVQISCKKLTEVFLISTAVQQENFFRICPQYLWVVLLTKRLKDKQSKSIIQAPSIYIVGVKLINYASDNHTCFLIAGPIFSFLSRSISVSDWNLTRYTNSICFSRMSSTIKPEKLQLYNFNNHILNIISQKQHSNVPFNGYFKTTLHLQEKRNSVFFLYLQ